MNNEHAPEANAAPPRILFCNCTYANVVPREVKRAVLAGLTEAGVPFEAVPDLCDLAARQDPSLKRLSDTPHIRIAACYERAVRWLFHGAGAPLPAEGVEVHNMRVDSAEDVLDGLLAPCAHCGERT